MVSIFAPDGTPDSHAGNHDFITFRRGTECATCKQVVRIWCNTCLVCHACFCASPRPCGEVVVNVADRGCHRDAQPFFFFLLRQPLSDVWWLPTNRHRLPTNRHRLHTNRHRLHTNRHRLHTNRHRLHTNRHRLPTNRHRLHTNRHRLHTNRHRLHTNRHRLPTNRHRLPTNRHRLHTNRHRLHTNRHQLPTNRHRLHTNRHRLHTNRHRLHTIGRIGHSEFFFLLLWQPLVAGDVCDEGENNSADELATPRKPDKGRGVARMQAKLVMAAQNGKLSDWTRGALLHCLEVLDVKVAGSSNQRQMRDLAMQHALPLLAQWDAFVPDTDRVTRSAAPPSSSQPSCSQPVDDMDGLIDE